MRYEEMTTDDLKQIAPYCDTVLLTVGGSSSRPAHLPVGTTWFLLRRLRDSLERALGGRILTLPVLHIDCQDDEDTLYQIPTASLGEMVGTAVRHLQRIVPIRHAILVTDSVFKETAMVHALTGNRDLTSITPYVWWRDGIGDFATGYTPSGTLETSMMLSIGERLVDLEQKSVLRYGALEASEALGNEAWTQVESTLRKTVEGVWEKAKVTL